MYCIGTIKQLNYGYFGIQAVFFTPRPSLFPSAPPLEINLGLGQWKTAYIPHNHTLTVYYSSDCPIVYYANLQIVIFEII